MTYVLVFAVLGCIQVSEAGWSTEAPTGVEGWQPSNDDNAGWQPCPASCIDESPDLSTKVCSNAFMITGGEKYQMTAVGEYAKDDAPLEPHHAGRAIYSNLNKQYMYYLELHGVWAVSADYNSQNARLLSVLGERALCPDEATNWKSYGDGMWIPGVRVKQACSHEIAVAGGEKYQSVRMGTYEMTSIVPGVNQDGRPIYHNAKSGQYVYYSGTFENWAASADYNADAAGLKSANGEHKQCPADAGNWLAYGGNTWNTGVTVESLCSHELTVTGAESFQPTGMGTYTRTGIVWYQRPIYKNPSNQFMYFFSTHGNWVVSADYHSQQIGIGSNLNEKKMCPDDATNWQAYGGGKWNPGVIVAEDRAIPQPPYNGPKQDRVVMCVVQDSSGSWVQSDASACAATNPPANERPCDPMPPFCSETTTVTTGTGTTRITSSTSTTVATTTTGTTTTAPPPGEPETTNTGTTTTSTTKEPTTTSTTKEPTTTSTQGPGPGPGPPDTKTTVTTTTTSTKTTVTTTTTSTTKELTTTSTTKEPTTTSTTKEPTTTSTKGLGPGPGPTDTKTTVTTTTTTTTVTGTTSTVTGTTSTVTGTTSTVTRTTSTVTGTTSTVTGTTSTVTGTTSTVTGTTSTVTGTTSTVTGTTSTVPGTTLTTTTTKTTNTDTTTTFTGTTTTLSGATTTSTDIHLPSTSTTSSAATASTKTTTTTTTTEPPEAETTLSDPVEVGATVLAVQSMEGFQVGREITIDPGTDTQEDNSIVSFGSLVLRDALKYEHLAGIKIIMPQAQKMPDRLNATLTAFTVVVAAVLSLGATGGSAAAYFLAGK